MSYKKKLIEVALPLDAINEASSTEKSINDGHPSTLHLWWARRPLAAARAVIFASLVDDPSSWPEEFPTEKEQDAERERLFNLLEQLVQWTNLNNEDLLRQAKDEISKSTDGNPPPLLDPFAGGGAIPLEAQRLGLKAYASDLNPVAVMINKAMIEIPPRFNGQAPVNPEARANLTNTSWKGVTGLAEDVRYYGEWMKQEAFKRIGHLYPTIKDEDGNERTVIAWIWARIVKCPNPACGCEMPLIKSYVLSSREGKRAILIPYINDGQVLFEVKQKNVNREDLEDAKKGTRFQNTSGRPVKATFTCPVCKNGVVNGQYADSEASVGRMGVMPIAIVSEGEQGRYYSVFTPDVAKQILDETDSYMTRMEVDQKVPREESKGTFASNAMGRRYSFFEFKDYFTERQLTALVTFSDLVQEVQKRVEDDVALAGLSTDRTELRDDGSGGRAYGQAIAIYLAFLVDKLADYNSSICSWIPSRETLRSTFARQAIPMVWDFAEANPFSNSTGSFTSMLTWIIRSISALPSDRLGRAFQFDAQSDNGMTNLMISTDPPYYDNISYADLSDFFYVWLRRSLKIVYPNLFSTLLVPKIEELVATPYRFDGDLEKAKDFFDAGMYQSCLRLFQYTRDDIPVTIYYAYKQTETSREETVSTGWETMLTSIIRAGFTITGTVPIRTEKPGRMLEVGTNALASSIVLVCRKRPIDAEVCSRRDFISALRRELKLALVKLQNANIAPVDLAQSAIGPGMEVFSRYSQVLEADGSPMTVRTALQIINHELDAFYSEQDQELDSDSRFCVDLFQQVAFGDIRFGEADVLARAKNTSVESMKAKGILFAQRGIVRLIKWDEISPPNDERDLNIWYMTQLLTRAIQDGGVGEVAEIVKKASYAPFVEKAKALAYRLYTITERKGWAAEAFAYNALVTSWKDVQANMEARPLPTQISFDDM